MLGRMEEPPSYLEVEEALYAEEAEGEDNVPHATGNSTDVPER